MLLKVLSFIAVLLVALVAGFAWVFVALFSRVRWYRSGEGRHIMRMTIDLALTFSLVLLFRVVKPDPLTSAVLSVALFGWLACELFVRIRLLLKAQAEARAIEAQRAADTSRT